MAKFDIVDIQTNLYKKMISVTMSLDVDDNTVSKHVLTLIQYDDSTRNHDFDIKVDGRKIDLVLKEWPSPNIPYLLKIQKGIKSIIGDDLSASFKHDIIFKSNVTNEIKIITPADYETVDKINVSFEEIGIEKVNSYLIEISRDNIFSDIVLTTTTVNNEILLDTLSSGQYYLRVRTQLDEEYGPWSNIITFILDKKNFEENPIFEDILDVVSYPEMCETPESFIFEFDGDITDDDITEDNFLILKKVF